MCIEANTIGLSIFWNSKVEKLYSKAWHDQNPSTWKKAHSLKKVWWWHTTVEVSSQLAFYYLQEINKKVLSPIFFWCSSNYNFSKVSLPSIFLIFFVLQWDSRLYIEGNVSCCFRAHERVIGPSYTVFMSISGSFSCLIMRFVICKSSILSSISIYEKFIKYQPINNVEALRLEWLSCLKVFFFK